MPGMPPAVVWTYPFCKCSVRLLGPLVQCGDAAYIIYVQSATKHRSSQHVQAETLTMEEALGVSWAKCTQAGQLQ